MKVGVILFAIFIAAIMLTIFGDRGLMDYRTLMEKRVALEDANQCIVNENGDLKREIMLLKSDLLYIESIARRELGMVKKGDMVYQFVD